MRVSVETILRMPGVLASSLTGSNYTEDPPVTDTDIDFLVLVNSLGSFCLGLEEDGWSPCSGASGHYEEETGYAQVWYAMRWDEYNLIITDDPGWYSRAVAATGICKLHNIRNKGDRIIVFRWLRDGGNATIGEKEYMDVLERWPV